MRLFTGQPEAMPLISLPVWQNGTPQSMQRAPCWRRRFSSMWWWNSFQSRTRSAGERSTGSSRRYSMNPVGFPIYLFFLLISADARRIARVLLERGHDGLVARQPLVVGAFEAGEHALVILRDHAQELRQPGGPGREDVLRVLAARGIDVFLDQRAQLLGFLRILDASDFDHLHVDALGRLAVVIQQVGDAARHAGREVAARGAQHHDAATRHVFA